MNSASKLVTQRDLARLAKVSHTTVSLALRNHPSIPEKTRRKIARLAERHHYRPDPMLAALNAYRVRRMSYRFQGTLAWMTSFPSRAGWRKMMQSEGYFIGARQQAERLGYHLEEFWISDPGLSGRRATQVLQARGVRGIVVAPLPAAHGNLVLEWERFSAVALGYSLAQPQLHVVMNHQFRNMKHLVTALQQVGYRRIGLAMPASIDDRVDHNYLGGYMVAQHEFPRQVARIRPLLRAVFAEQDFRRWFRTNRPDAVVTAASSAYEVMDWLARAGVAVPGDVGVAVASVPFGDTVISGIDENVRGVGAIAVDTVVGMIHRNEMGIPRNPWRILTEGTWHGGRTITGQPEMKRPLSLKTADEEATHEH